jgi:hypothetical protein
VSNAIGAAVASVVAVGLLSLLLASGFSSSGLPAKLETAVLFDNVDFVSNHALRSVLGENVGDAGADRQGGVDLRGRPATRVASGVLDRGRDLVVVDPPCGAIAEICAGRVVSRGDRERGE